MDVTKPVSSVMIPGFYFYVFLVYFFLHSHTLNAIIWSILRFICLFAFLTLWFVEKQKRFSISQSGINTVSQNTVVCFWHLCVTKTISATPGMFHMIPKKKNKRKPKTIMTRTSQAKLKYLKTWFHFCVFLYYKLIW